MLLQACYKLVLDDILPAYIGIQHLLTNNISRGHGREGRGGKTKEKKIYYTDENVEEASI